MCRRALLLAMRSQLALPLLAVLLSTPATTANVLSAGRYSFDEIQVSLGYGPAGNVDKGKFVDSPPGSFARDYHWSLTRTGDQDHGDANHESIAYYDGWTRVETFKPYEETIQFANRRQRVVVRAQVNSHTYRRYVGADATGWLSPEEPSEKPQPKSSYSGSETIQYTTTYSPLPPMVFEGIRTQGRRSMIWIRTIAGTGSCKSSPNAMKNRLFETKDEYRAAGLEPPEPFLSLWHDEVHLISTCRTRTVISPEGPAQKSFDRRFLVYSRETDYSDDRGVRPIFINVTERGHIRNLSARDWQALQLPRYYTDSCLRRPVPYDCRPRPSYANLQSHVAARSAHTNNIWSIIESAGGDIVFAEHDHNRIARLSSTGNLREITLPVSANPERLVESPDGSIWFTQDANGAHQVSGIGYLTPQDSYHEFMRFPATTWLSNPFIASNRTPWYAAGNSSGSTLYGRTVDGNLMKRKVGVAEMPDGLFVDGASNAWLADFYGNKIVRIGPSGSLRTIRFTEDEHPSTLAAYGNVLWFAAADAVGYIDSAGDVHKFTVPRTDSRPGDLVMLPDGRALYSSEHRLGVVAIDGSIREFSVTGSPGALLFDSKGRLWYSDSAGGALRVIPDFLKAIRDSAS